MLSSWLCSCVSRSVFRLRQTVSNLNRQTRWLLVGVGIVIFAPIAHVAVEVALVTHRGKLIYKTHFTVGSGAVHDTTGFLHEDADLYRLPYAGLAFSRRYRFGWP